MNDIPEYLANIRYMTNEMILQLDTVHRLCCDNELDIGTVLLNVSDLRTQMTDIVSELDDMYDKIGASLMEEEQNGES